MGDLKVCLPKQSRPLGGLTPTNPSPQPPFPAARWWPLEQSTQRITRLVRPTILSEAMRQCIVDYVQNLIKRRLGAEVFSFGSVPLKVYLPDGDIDLMVVGASNMNENLALGVHAALEEEEMNMNADFEVKDVQYINAEVKLVKCLIDNIIIDISFCQIGGLRTLCLLEQVDILIGNNNLFKRSIILIKAWCYYESRILGAHHALISTYALEILILYIFHLFHSSLDGPLSVLYRFLEYFSKFDWDNFCISLRGPVHKCFLPDIVAEPPDNAGGDLLFSTEFLNTCGERSSVPPGASEDNHQLFLKKYLNIIDPLKENNNLGRSVSKGNFYRIRSAFAYGARKLFGILALSGRVMEDELNKFFANTIERHTSGEMPDLQRLQYDVSFDCTDERNAVAEIKTRKNAMNNSTVHSSTNNFSGRAYEGSNNMKHLGSRKQNGCSKEAGIKLSNCYPSGNHLHVNRNEGLALLSAQVQMVKNHHAAGRYLNCRSSKETPNPSSLKESEVSSTSNKLQQKSCFSSHYHDLNQSKVLRSNSYMNGHMSSAYLCGLDSSRDMAAESYPSSKQAFPSIRTNGSVRIPTDTSAYCSHTTMMGPQISWAGELVELSGDDSGHRKNLIYAQWCHDRTLHGVPPRNRPTHIHSANLGDTHRQPNMAVHKKGIIPLPPSSDDANYHPMRFGNFPCSNGMNALPKNRGTGTFFPITNHRVQEERSRGRGSNQLAGNSALRSLSRSPASTFPADMGGHKVPPPNISMNGYVKSGLLKIPQASSPVLPNGSPKSGCTGSPDRQIEFGSYKSPPAAVSAPILMPMGTSNLEPVKSAEANDLHDDHTRIRPTDSSTLS